MNWFNEDQTKMIDIDSINGYVYINADQYIANNSEETDVDDFKKDGDKLELIIGGSVFLFRGEAAKEIFCLLRKKYSTQSKETLYG
jgi:hypothetical protein